MDETSYSDPGNISLINSLFVPIRVDTDQRPDINQRYNTGGWPSTVFLTPEGDILAGGTYIPPAEFRRLLETISTVYHTRKVDIATAMLEQRQHQAPQDEASATGELGRHIVQEMLDLLAQDFDSEHGGFGESPKFPETDALELLLFYHRLTGEASYLSMVTKTLQALASGGLFDPVAGGFFRYSTTADWSLPHYEKMLEGNVRLLSIYLSAYQLTGEPALSQTASRTMDYLMSTLYQPETGAFAGSQDAEEEYYHLSSEGRARRAAPAVDPAIYTPWNAQAATALLQASRVLGQPQARKTALGVLGTLWGKCQHRARGMFHYYAKGRPHLLGLLMDQVTSARAMLAAYEDTGSSLYLKRAEHLATVMARDFAHPQGGFYDRVEEPGGQGYLGRRLRFLEENTAVAELLHRLSLWTGQAHYQELAQGALRPFAGKYRGYGRLGAAYALAVARVLFPAVVIKVSRADSPPGRELYRASLGLSYSNTLVRRLSPAEASTSRGPYALVCLEDRCLPPITEAVQLGSALTQLVSPVA